MIAHFHHAKNAAACRLICSSQCSASLKLFHGLLSVCLFSPFSLMDSAKVGSMITYFNLTLLMPLQQSYHLPKMSFQDQCHPTALKQHSLIPGSCYLNLLERELSYRRGDCCRILIHLSHHPFGFPFGFFLQF